MWVKIRSSKIQHAKKWMRNCCLFVCLSANKLYILSLSLALSSSSSRLTWRCTTRYSLWLGIPFGFARHGEALVEREGDERAGRLSGDGGQLLNWTTNKQAWKCDSTFRSVSYLTWYLVSGSQPVFGLWPPSNKAISSCGPSSKIIRS